MTLEEKKEYLKKNDLAKFAKELVEGSGWTVEGAVEYVYDQNTMTTEQFVAKYFKR